MRTHAEGVIVVVVNGDRGSGFSVQTEYPTWLAAVPQTLRDLADSLEADIEEGKF